MDISSLTTCFDISSVHPEQKEAIDSVLIGKDVVILPTGFGKSFIYQSIAWLSQKPKALVLVVSHLIALMRNQVSTLTEYVTKKESTGELGISIVV